MTRPQKELQGKTILVTGGAGFVGSHLCDRLIDYGARVVCLDDLSTGNKYYIDSRADDRNFVFVLGDANNFTDVWAVFERHTFDYVFHYAAVVGVQRTMENPLAVLNDLEGIKHICKLASQHGVKKIVFSSSSEIYGNQKEVPLHEEQSYHDTKHPYALVKATAESYLKAYWESTGLPVTSLRFFNVYGPRQEHSRYGFVTGIFISQVLKGLRPTIFRDGTQTRDFTYIDDNIEAAIQALLSKKTNGHVLNIGTGAETSILELAERIIALSGKKIKPKLLKRVNLYETQRRVADTSKLEQLVGLLPKTSLEEGLKKTYDWYRTNPHVVMSKEKMDYDTYEKGVMAA